jgi:hypothetical protein
VAEDLVRACWGVHTLYHETSPGDEADWAAFQKQVSFPVKPVPAGGWTDRFWAGLGTPEDEGMLFIIGAPEPRLSVLPKGFSKVYALQAGLLPQQAGPDAASWALARGEARTGATLYHRSEKPYSGDLLFEQPCDVTDKDDAASLEAKLKELAIQTVRDFWETSTRAQLRFQRSFTSETVRPSWAGGPVPWKESTKAVHGFVRASTHPREGAYTYLKGRRLRVWKASPAVARGEIKRWRAGDVFSFDPFRVWTGDGLVKLDRVQWEGEEEMPGTDFARTRGIEAGLTLEDAPPAGGRTVPAASAK